jgi:hypothetical protein
MESIMRINSTLAVLIAGLAFGLAASAAQAAPVAGAGSLGQTAEASLSRVDYRVCRYSGGVRVCRWYEDDDDEDGEDEVIVYSRRNSDLDVGTRSPEEFETGSTEWWRAMDRAGRGGLGRR